MRIKRDLFLMAHTSLIQTDAEHKCNKVKTNQRMNLTET